MALIPTARCWAQQACADTDLPFSYWVNRERGVPVSITFRFQLATPEDKSATKTPPEPEVDLPEAALLLAPTSKK